MAARKPKAPAKPVVPEITAQDAHNLIQLLDRVQTQGIQEAMVLGILANKLQAIKASDPNVGGPGGEDVPSTDE